MMRVLMLACVVSIAASTAAVAADAPVKPETVRRLIKVTQVGKILDAYMAQIDAGMESGIRQAMRGKPLTPEQQKVLDDMRAKMLAIFKESLNWETLEPVLIDVYTRTFTESEVEGMLAFYETPAGKALITKTPQLMQNTAQAMQSQVSALLPKFQKLEEETMAQLKAADAKPAGDKPDGAKPAAPPKDDAKP
jgi:hypothetical protein